MKHFRLCVYIFSLLESPQPLSCVRCDLCQCRLSINRHQPRWNRWWRYILFCFADRAGKPLTCNHFPQAILNWIWFGASPRIMGEAPSSGGKLSTSCQVKTQLLNRLPWYPVLLIYMSVCMCVCGVCVCVCVCVFVVCCVCVVCVVCGLSPPRKIR